MIEKEVNDTKDSPVIYFSRLSWVIFLAPVISFLVAISIHIYINVLPQISLFLTGFALIWILMTWITYQFSSITIKKKRIILHTGLVVRQTVDIPLNKIESIDIRRTILGSLLRYGTLIVTGTGGTRQYVNYLDKPLTCRRYIEQLMNEP